MVHVFESELVKCVQEISVGIQDKKVAGHISLAQGFFWTFWKILKTQANSHENSSKISEKLKNRQLNLSFYNIKVAFSFQKCAAG